MSIGLAINWSLIFVVPLVGLFIRYQRYYQTTSREIKRLDAISRSPVYAMLNECLNGLASIRAYQATHRLATQYPNPPPLTFPQFLWMF